MSLAAAIALCLLPAASATGPATPATLPADWPPLPDFTSRVDYAGWCMEVAKMGCKDNAAPMWEELRIKEDDSDEVKRRKEQLWGRDAKDIPGLFTGPQSGLPDRLAWDPDEETDWEASWQLQRVHGLHEKLIVASKYPCFVRSLYWSDEPTGPNQTVPIFSANDRLLINARSPSVWVFSVQRQAVKVLLQNAWRAPKGRVDPEAMLQSITASLRIARQAEQSGTERLLGVLVGLAIRQLAYDQAIRALGDEIFDARHISMIEAWLREHDDRPLDCRCVHADEVARLAELLQFAYESAGGTWPQPPRVNQANVQKLERAAAADPFKRNKPLLDLVGEIDRYDPLIAVQQLVGLELAVQKAEQARLPQDAYEAAGQLYREFIDNPQNHVVLRQFVGEATAVHITFIARAEAMRRGTRLMYALHRHHDKTGRWPESLESLAPAVPEIIRTDPFAGRPFIYRIEDGGALLYSVGLDGRDDGGQHDPHWGWRTKDPKNTDYVFWPLSRRRT